MAVDAAETRGADETTVVEIGIDRLLVVLTL